MYLDHFGLAEPPFRITPNTEFFFAGAKRGATLDALMYAVLNDQGIVKVSGEVGSGKTMLCRVLMERLPKQVVLVYLANPSLSRDDIVFAIADELGLALSETTKISGAVRMLQDRLIELHADGHPVVVLVDEAHAMPLETLEEVRLLSNLETRHHKLLQLVLFGQPELDIVLARPDMRQLRERITHNFRLEPLHRDDIARYIDFRMRTAGYRGPEVFSPQAIGLIARASHGLTRRVNILSEKSLLAAFAQGVHLVTPREVRAAIRDAQYEDPGARGRMALLVASGFALAGAVATALLLGKPAPDGSASDALATHPGPSDAGPASSRSGAPSPAVMVPKTMASDSKPPARGQYQSVERQAAEPAPAPAPRAPNTMDGKRRGATLELRLNETREWIKNTAPNRWFIQLLTSNAADTVFAAQFLEKADRLLDPKRAGAYIAEVSGEQRVGIIYGDFDSQEAALQEIANLPADLRAHKPFPRQFIRLK